MTGKRSGLGMKARAAHQSQLGHMVLAFEKDLKSRTWPRELENSFQMACFKLDRHFASCKVPPHLGATAGLAYDHLF